MFVRQGREVVASAPGEVVIAQYEPGKDIDPNILIYHGHGISTIYVHMRAVSVKPGEEVYRGQIIGISGKAATPKWEPAHLHFQTNSTYRKGQWGNNICPYENSLWTKDSDPQHPD